MCALNGQTENLLEMDAALPDSAPTDAVQVAAIDQVAAKYYRDQQRWRLCDSAFDPYNTSLRAMTVRGLLP